MALEVCDCPKTHIQGLKVYVECQIPDDQLNDMFSLWRSFLCEGYSCDKIVNGILYHTVDKKSIKIDGVMVKVFDKWIPKVNSTVEFAVEVTLRIYDSFNRVMAR